MGMTRVQFNPSTLKTIYKASTNKIQENEAFCENYIFTLEASGITDCDLGGDCTWPSDANQVYVCTFASRLANDCSYLSPNPCVNNDWCASITINFNTNRIRYISIDLHQAVSPHYSAFDWSGYMPYTSSGQVDSENSCSASCEAGCKIGEDGIVKWCKGSYPGGCP